MNTRHYECIAEDATSKQLYSQIIIEHDCMVYKIPNGVILLQASSIDFKLNLNMGGIVRLWAL
jgi:hypothetical protein